MTMDKEMALFHSKMGRAFPRSAAHTPLLCGFRSAVLLTASLVCLAACEDAKPARTLPRAQTASAQKPQPVAPAEQESAAASAPVHEYAYSPIGKRDPFRSIMHDAEREAALQKAAAEAAAAASKPPVEAPVENLRCGPLCKWDIEQLRLVAVVSGVSNPMAMVETPDGRGYSVHRGTFIGKRNGKITQIRPGEIVVTEIYKDNSGVPQPNDISIYLPRSANDTADISGESNLMNVEIEP